ncbi:MAG: methyltransferase domain-containing protein [Polyangiaceae bacterium]
MPGDADSSSGSNDKPSASHETTDKERPDAALRSSSAVGDVDWEQAWQAGRTRWDAGKSSPKLLELEATGEITRLLDSVGTDSRSRGHMPGGARRLLVPGAGSGYDVLTLASVGRHVTGLDLAPSALDRFAKLKAETATDGSAEFLCRDFFELSEDPGQRASYDLVWDYTFFCALAPRLRDAWAAAQAALLRPNGILLTLMYPLIEGDDVDREQGPPFPLSRAIYHQHLVETARFSLEHFETVAESHPSREGREGFGVWRRKALP